MSPGIESTNSSSFTVPAVTSYRSPGGTPPVLVRKFINPKNLVDLGAIALAPLTGGASALGLGALRGAQALRGAGKVGVARGAAKEASEVAASKQAVKPRSAVAETRDKLAEGMADAGEDRTSMAQLRSRTANPVPEVEPKLQAEVAEHNAKRLQEINETTQAAAEADKNLQELQSEQKERQRTAAATGLVGIQSSTQAASTNREKQQAEMERIERLAEEGRAKASTGSKIAVT